MLLNQIYRKINPSSPRHRHVHDPSLGSASWRRQFSFSALLPVPHTASLLERKGWAVATRWNMMMTKARPIVLVVVVQMLLCVLEVQRDVWIGRSAAAAVKVAAAAVKVPAAVVEVLYVAGTGRTSVGEMGMAPCEEVASSMCLALTVMYAATVLVEL